MKRVIAIVALILSLLVGHALAAYDPEYGDESGKLPAFTVLNSLDGWGCGQKPGLRKEYENVHS